MTEKKKTSERVEDMTTINFSITKCPMKVFKKFAEFAKEETCDNYSMALKILLDGMKANVKEMLLYEQYMEMKVRLDELELEFENLKKQPEEEEDKPEEGKTFS
jgi:hypothetical protein